MTCLVMGNGKKINIDDDLFDVLWNSIEEPEEEETNKKEKRKRNKKNQMISIISLIKNEDILKSITKAMTDVMSVKDVEK